MNYVIRVLKISYRNSIHLKKLGHRENKEIRFFIK